MGRTGALSQQISARVRMAIEAAEISWAEASRLTDIPRETLRRRLNDVDPFTTDELEMVATALGLARDVFTDKAQWQEGA